MDAPRTRGHWLGLDLDALWTDSDWSRESYTEGPPGEALVREVEAQLGVRLPDSYVKLAQVRNGGALARTAFVGDGLGRADDLVEVVALYAIGRTAPHSLLGAFSTWFWREEWGYPDLGVVVADTPSAGHDLVMLDYRHCGPRGEPAVVHVDQDLDYRVLALAPDFATFVRGLVDVHALGDQGVLP
ncbi:Cell wall assembly/cell proliferation coordinating protein, KNR4-like protein [Cellulomonas flavigena DSM 20109]|uniref:Cell wall assembly/cell proliferation coordinating protein, KNR4-like protein n=1 Tax=Cellulomonas flavigena (strain ATCC 482 / DSM 20109 / BCRC 11376 / JCM 18109 / NBRC 3775 / NCIMB 8073 / NRS 134) TaxID=446466 RepID=D5UHP5_CELFN|nr:SMI1/KNR4 family protein [Cellulomonas flavigena]ADG73319.1 Cell wall assembly/cell proliferation coordinating protein, KNR4-like protein [Cellulomonas flavigena DSM 20109]